MHGKLVYKIVNIYQLHRKCIGMNISKTITLE